MSDTESESLNLSKSRGLESEEIRNFVGASDTTEKEILVLGTKYRI